VRFDAISRNLRISTERYQEAEHAFKETMRLELGNPNLLECVLSNFIIRIDNVSLREIGRTLLSRSKFEQAIICFEKANQLRQIASLHSKLISF
jgi:tetratricopeptide (TPR) repeat protein